MAKLTREELMSKFTSYIGEDTSDAALELMEDINDSFDSDLSSYVDQIEELKRKVEETDNMWREKYKARFTDYTPDTSSSNISEVDTGDNSEADDIEPPTEEELGSILAEY